MWPNDKAPKGKGKWELFARAPVKIKGEKGTQNQGGPIPLPK